MSGQDVPQGFRIDIEVGSLDEAEEFYSTLLDLKGRRAPGARIYFDCGPLTLQVVDVTGEGRTLHPLPKALYFTVNDVDAVHTRASALNATDDELVHGERGGDISVRPWGERSFYLRDPWNNPLCFVQDGTVYPG